MIIFGLTGSGFFADDKAGKVLEIYLSRLKKREYFIGKFGAIILFINIFILLPLIITCGYLVAATGRDHLDYFDLYLRIALYSLLCSVILGLFILTLSIFVEKRSYAGLIFVLVYLFGTIIGGLIAQDNPNNKFYLLISPANFFALLAYVCLGDYDLGVWAGLEILALHLNDGYSLEYWHVILQYLLLTLALSLILAYKMGKMTTEELS
jgi:ABC-type transport system involved in multi-copper enzyme maturation permease subunit